MKHRDFYSLTASSIMASFTGAMILTTSAGWKGVIAGLMTAGTVLMLEAVKRKGRREGKTPRMKTALNISVILTELLILVGAFSLSIVPKYAAVLTLAAIAFVELLKLESENDLNASFAHDIGRNGRMAVLALSLAAYTVNPYFLFYGLLFAGLLAVYDALRLLHRLNQEA